MLKNEMPKYLNYHKCMYITLIVIMKVMTNNGPPIAVITLKTNPNEKYAVSVFFAMHTLCGYKAVIYPPVENTAITGMQGSSTANSTTVIWIVLLFSRPLE